MFVINELRTSLNVQSDSLRAKVLNCSFNWILLLLFFFCMLYFILLSFSNIYYSTLHIYMRTHIYAFLSVIFTGLNLLRDDFFKRSAMYKENIPTISFQQGSNKPRD